MKRNTVCIIGVPEEKVKGVENLFQEIMAENIPQTGKDLVIQVHEANRSPQNVNPKCSSPRHRVIKLSKNKQTNKPPPPPSPENFYSSRRKK